MANERWSKKKYRCLTCGMSIDSIVNDNKYYMTRKMIYVINSQGELVKKIGLPKTNDWLTNQRMQGFMNMIYYGSELMVMIYMQDYYDRKTVLDEDLLVFGELSLHR